MEYTYDYEPYILNELNMTRYLKYLSTPTTQTQTQTQTQPKKTSVRSNPRPHQSHTMFVPKEQDPLFWCYYVMSNGDCAYEMLPVKNALIAKQLKIGCVGKLRAHKQSLKAYKFDSLSGLENNLANDPAIHIKTVMSLCVIDEINVVYVSRKTYFELKMKDDAPVYILRELDTHSKYVKQYGLETADPASLQHIKSTFLFVDTLSKPIRALSFYKVADLVNICNTLAIQTVRNDTGKPKTKNELYESIIQYF